MAARSVQDQVQALLSRQVAEAKVGGVPSSDVEAASILETIATNFLLFPRASLVLAFMAKNALVSALRSEIALLETLRQDVNDLGNQTFAIVDTSSLSRAQVSLTQMGINGSVSSDGSAFTNYSSAIDSFLNKSLAKNVRAPNSSSLVRPGSEAGQDMPGDFQAVVAAHADVLDRLTSLTVGVHNFLSCPMSALVSANLLTRVQGDLQSILQSYQSDSSGSDSRDVATRLLAARAALRLFGQPPDIDAPIALGVPVTSEEVAPAVILTGPFTLPSGELDIQTSNFEQVTVPDFGAPGVLGTSLVEPIVIPPNYFLFVQLFDSSGNPFISTNPNQSSWTSSETGSVIRIPLNTSGSPVSLSVDSLISLFASSGISAQRFFAANSIYLSCDTSGVSGIKVVAQSVEPNSSATISIPSIYTNSAHSLLGFSVGQSGKAFVVPADILHASIQQNCQGVTSVVDGYAITITAVDASPGSTIQFSGTWASAMGLSTVTPTSDTLSLDVPAELSSGDRIVLPDSSDTVSDVGDSSIVLQNSFPTFTGAADFFSGLAATWHVMDTQLWAFMAKWLKTDLSSSLVRMDRAIAILVGSPTSPNGGAAIALINELEGWLNQAINAINMSPPPDSGPDEQTAINGIIETLSERKYDKAVDYLTRCKISDVFQMDWQTASYAGSMLKAASDLARTDVIFPDHTKDQDSTVDGVQDRVGYS